MSRRAGPFENELVCETPDSLNDDRGLTSPPSRSRRRDPADAPCSPESVHESGPLRSTFRSSCDRALPGFARDRDVPYPARVRSLAFLGFRTWQRAGRLLLARGGPGRGAAPDVVRSTREHPCGADALARIIHELEPPVACMTHREARIARLRVSTRDSLSPRPLGTPCTQREQRNVPSNRRSVQHSGLLTRFERCPTRFRESSGLGVSRTQWRRYRSLQRWVGPSVDGGSPIAA